MNRVNVARLGRTVGLKGYLKIQILSDFPEIIIIGREFYCGDFSVCVAEFDCKQALIRFRDYDTKEQALVLSGEFLQCSIEQTRQWCALSQNNYFWFDVIGATVSEDGQKLGIVSEIERIGMTDYLVVATDDNLVQKGSPKRFMLPFIDRFITDVVCGAQNLCVLTQGAKDILDAS